MLYQRVLVTGANGLLGQELVHQMSSRPDYDVLATAREDEPKFSGGSCGYVPLDVTDEKDVSSVFQDFSPDVVVNCAALTEVDRCESEREACWQVNADAVNTLAKQCLTSGSRIIQVSTDFIFDGLEGPYKESDRPNPLSYYGRSKLAGENGARRAGMEHWAIARTVLVFGAGENLSRSNFVLWVIDQLSRGESIRVVTDQWRTPTYAPDLAQGIERIVRLQKQGVYHISGREMFSIHELAIAVAEAFDLDQELIVPTDGSEFTQPAIRPPRTGFLVLKAETELGYKPHSLQDALQDLSRRLIALEEAK
ncbi:MAG: dTDP-4-dehydrorhamnose reductase [Rhodothermia bacterium]|nr:MAG: dTDP-4-dehydrorhamnose reductase [Rhodothermia bacterium]